MSSDVNSIKGLLYAIDEEIERYFQSKRIIYRDFYISEGEENKLCSLQRNNLYDRLNNTYKIYQDNSRNLLILLDKMCKKLRVEQPGLENLEAVDFGKKYRMPDKLVLGRLGVEYLSFNEKVPRTVAFPFEKAIFINDEKYFTSLHKLFLRLMSVSPMGKCKFRILDPYYVGGAVQDFNYLMGEKNIFSDGRVLIDSHDMKKALIEESEYARNLIQNVFTTDCPDWASYNLLQYSKGEYKKMLDYKVLAFFGLPYGLSSDNFDLFTTLLNVAHKCGILIIFAYNQEVFDQALSNPNCNDKIILGMRGILERASNIRDIVFDTDINSRFKHLKIDVFEENYPDKQKLSKLLTNYVDEIKNIGNQGSITFNDLTDRKYLFTQDATEGLEIPIGEKLIDKSTLIIKIGDDNPHYCIGGASGSGKSNFLHNFIMSACWRYSPKELEVYLLDFKMGTEFNIYGHAKLPHAKLISVSDNDPDYGVSVLDHIEKEIVNRSELFRKDPDCADYKSFRKRHPQSHLPRLLVIVDEFQVLLEGSGAMNRLLTLAKQGRSFGVHMIFATQTLKGLNFSEVGTQFRGRIAMHCDEMDSATILGPNNVEAAHIQKPLAIINTGSGSSKENSKFFLPFADKNIMMDVLKVMYSKSRDMGFNCNTKIYNGDNILNLSNDIDWKSQGKILKIKLGVNINVEENPFSIEMPLEEDSNLLIIGKNKGIHDGILKSTLFSAAWSGHVDLIAYGGPMCHSLPKKCNNIPIISKESIFELYSSIYEDIESKRIMLIIDNCNIIKEFDANISYGGNVQIKDNNKKNIGLDFFKFLTECSSKGSYCIAFYDTLMQLTRKASKETSNFSFLRNICYGMTESDMNKISSLQGRVSKGKMPDNRAVYVEDETVFWFKPFVGESDV